MGTVIVGKIESGYVRKGDTLVLMPLCGASPSASSTTRTSLPVTYSPAR